MEARVIGTVVVARDGGPLSLGASSTVRVDGFDAEPASAPDVAAEEGVDVCVGLSFVKEEETGEG